MGTLLFRRSGVVATAIVIAGASLTGIVATATPAAAAHSGTKFTASKYGTVTVSSLPTAPNVTTAAPAGTARAAKGDVTATPNFNTLDANAVESETSTSAYTNNTFEPFRTNVARSPARCSRRSGRTSASTTTPVRC